MPENVLTSIRYLFYLFVLSIPVESASGETVAAIGAISMIFGMALMGAALLQPGVCFNLPPGAFWYFVGYFVLCLTLAFTQNLDYLRPALTRLFTFAQMLVLMWICFNLLRYPEICKGAFLSLVAGCLVLSVMQVAGVGTVDVGHGRSSMSGANANTVGATLSLGLIALVGITYGRTMVDRRLKLIAWVVFPIIGTAIIMTGSRGALLALMFGIALLLLRGGTWRDKLKIGSIALLAVGFLVVTALSDEAMRTRLERSFYLGDTAGRDKIHAQAWAMFFEKPLLGWGPVYNLVELGSRLGMTTRDPHSLYLSVLTETGLFGSMLFFCGLGLLGRAAWQARLRIEGALPIAMLGCLLAFNLTGSWHWRKLFWFTAAYVLASAWPLRDTVQQTPVQFTGSTNTIGQDLRTTESFSQTTKGVSGAGPAR